MVIPGPTFWRFAAALSGARTADDVARTLAQHGAGVAGASFSNLALYEPWSDRLIVTHGPSLDPEIAARWAVFDLDEDTPLGTAIIYGQPVLLGSVRHIAHQFPELVEDTVRAGLAATASLPLRDLEGTVIGAAGFAWPEEQIFDEGQLTTLGLIASVAEQALDRALVYERERTQRAAVGAAQVKLLQDAFVPARLPETPGLEVAAAYLPASGEPMGGDWYDVFTVGTKTCLVIGDVAGHGLHSTGVMAQLRNGLRAFASEDASPWRLLTRLNRMLCAMEPDATASALVALFDPANGTIVRANAGHPPLLRCRPGDFAFRIPRAPGVLLGVDPAHQYRQERATMPPGTTMLFYTDGLIESRHASLDQGMEELCSFVATLEELSPQQVCNAVIRWRTEGPEREDDLCVVAARVRAPAPN